jgi:hypothetical protein
MRVLGAILTILGFLISLSGLGAILGVPMIVIGVTLLLAPAFSISVILAAFVSFMYGGNNINHENLNNYFFIFLILVLIFWLLQYLIINYDNLSSKPISVKVVDIGNNSACPFCKELINFNAVKCRHCGSDVIAENQIGNIVKDKMNSEDFEKLLEKVKFYKNKDDAISLLDVCGYSVIEEGENKYKIIKSGKAVYIDSEENLIYLSIARAIKSR